MMLHFGVERPYVFDFRLPFWTLFSDKLLCGRLALIGKVNIWVSARRTSTLDECRWKECCSLVWVGIGLAVPTFLTLLPNITLLHTILLRYKTKLNQNVKIIDIVSLTNEIIECKDINFKLFLKNKIKNLLSDEP